MHYNVSQLLMEPIGSTRRFQLEGSVAGGIEGPRGGRANGSVRLLRTHQGLLVNGVVEVEVAAACGRCLTDFVQATKVTLEEECYPTVDPSTGRRMAPPDEAEGVLHIDTRHMLDLSDVLRQYLLTSEPLKMLCRDDCQGLCPECGADLNMEKCNCTSTPVDPRWGTLTDLLS